MMIMNSIAIFEKRRKSNCVLERKLRVSSEFPFFFLPGEKSRFGRTWLSYEYFLKLRAGIITLREDFRKSRA
jgi:hypothetical protein